MHPKILRCAQNDSVLASAFAGMTYFYSVRLALLGLYGKDFNAGRVKLRMFFKISFASLAMTLTVYLL